MSADERAALWIARLVLGVVLVACLAAVFGTTLAYLFMSIARALP